MDKKVTTSLTGSLTAKNAGISLKPSFQLRLCLILAVITFAVYANTLNNGFVLDDVTVITKNIHVTSGIKGIPALLTTPRLKGYQTTRDQESYRPVPMITHAIEYELFGANAAMGHLFNILFFIGCAISLFLFIEKLFPHKKANVAFVTSLLFALHPIHTEVVANIKSRDELLCFLFGFISLNMFAKYARSGRLRQLLAGALVLLLSFLSKETIITFLFVIPLVFFFYLNEHRKRSICITITTLLVTICFLATRMAVLPSHHSISVFFLSNPLIAAPGTSTRIATAFWVLGRYLKLLFVPYPLICDYSYNSVPFTGWGNLLTLLSLFVYVLLLAVGIYRLIRLKKDTWAFGILFFLITLALFSNIFFLVYSEMAERFLFFPSVGFCLCLALAYERWISGIPPHTSVLKSKVGLTTLIPICLVFATITILRNTDWKDNMTLFSTDMTKSANNAELIYFVGNELQNPERSNPATQPETDQESIGLFNKALAIYPDMAAAHTSLGGMYERLQMYDSAVVHDSIALALIPGNSIASFSLANAYAALKKYPEAISYYKVTLALQPGFGPATINMAHCFTENRQYDSAIVYFGQILKTDPEQEAAIQGLAYANAMKKAAETKPQVNP